MTDTNNEWIEQARLTYNEIPIGGKECKDEETAFKQAILYNFPKPTKVVVPVDIEDIIEKIGYIKRYSDTRYFDWEEAKNELKKLIIDNLPKSISRESVEKLRDKRKKKDNEYADTSIMQFIKELDILLDNNGTDDTN